MASRSGVEQASWTGLIRPSTLRAAAAIGVAASPRLGGRFFGEHYVVRKPALHSLSATAWRKAFTTVTNRYECSPERDLSYRTDLASSGPSPLAFADNSPRRPALGRARQGAERRAPTPAAPATRTLPARLGFQARRGRANADSRR